MQLPTMTMMESVTQKKLKIKFASKKVEVETNTGFCGLAKGVVSVSVNGSKQSQRNKLNDLKLRAADNQKFESLKVKLPMPCSNKRGSLEMVEGQIEKRRKMDRSVKQDYGSILKTLMTHPAGWVFNEPVDPVALKIPDYFSIISDPMDLGTVRTKLENNLYFNGDEFAADVRLTFSNAMLYNPPSNNVHRMAKELENIFSRKWALLDSKSKNVGHDISNGRGKNFPVSLPKSSMSSEEKQKLRKELVELSKGMMTENLSSFLHKLGLKIQKQGKPEVDIDALDDETIRELKRLIKLSLDRPAANAKPSKMKQNGRVRPLTGVVHKGTDSVNRITSGSVNSKRPPNSVALKCGTCGNMTCRCSLLNDKAPESSSDISSGKLLRQDDHGAEKMDLEANGMPTSNMSLSDHDSDDGVDCSLGIDVQLSPRKALRVAMLKSRFAGTILKAKQKTLLNDGDIPDPVKLQQEKERLERQQREEKARIEAQIKAAEAAVQRAEMESKLQREREREAARIALEKMEKTVYIDDNLAALKKLEMLSRSEDGSKMVMGIIGFGLPGSPLEQLGLFMKEDLVFDDVDLILNAEGEEGEIFS